MRKRARTVLCGGRSAMVVPTASTGLRYLNTAAFVRTNSDSLAKPVLVHYISEIAIYGD
jgi:hypothetical protein